MTRETRRSFIHKTGLSGALLAGSGSALGSAAAYSGSDAAASGGQAGAAWTTDRGSAARTANASSVDLPYAPPVDKRATGDVSVDSALAVVDGVAYFYDQEQTNVVAYDLDAEEPQWQTAVAPGSNPEVTVADGRVYASGGSSVTVDDVPQLPSLAVLDAADGSVEWEREFRAETVSGPTVADGTVFVEVDGVLLALATDCHTLWSADVQPQSNPAVAADKLVFVDQDGVAALDVSDGAELWRHDGPYAHVAVDDGTVYATRDDYLVTFDIADGTEQWRTGLGSGGEPDAFPDSLSEIAVGEDRVYVPTSWKYVRAFAKDDGAFEWENDEFRESMELSLSVDDGTLYAVNTDRGAPGGFALMAHDAATGSRHWRWELSPIHSDAEPALADGDLYLPGDDIIVFTADHPNVEWYETFHAGEPSIADFDVAPIVTDEAVLVASANGDESTDNAVAAIDRATHETQWVTEIGAPISAVFDLADETVVAGSESELVGLDPASGTVEWRALDDDSDATVSTASVVDGSVYALRALPFADRREVVALDAATGTEQWRVEAAEDRLTGTSADDFVVADGQVYLVTESTSPVTLLALDAASGALQWRIQDSYIAPIDATDGYVFTGDTRSELVARRAEDGEVAWRDEVRGVSDVGFESADGVLYVPSQRVNGPGVVRAYDVDDGSVLWRESYREFRVRNPFWTTDPYGSFNSQPVYADGTLYLTNLHHAIAVDAADGSVQGSYEAYAYTTGVSVSDGTAFFTDGAGHLTALALTE